MAYILTLRMEKGSMLTYEELDDNFLFLKQKVEALESAETSADAVLFTPQELTPGQKQIVWGNIGSMAVDFSNLPANLSAEAKSSFKQKLDIPESFEIVDYVSYTPNQKLESFQQTAARDNILAIDRKLNELSDELLENEQKEIQNKLGFSFEGFVKNLEYKEGENEWRYEIVGEDTIIVPIVPQFIIDKIQTLENSIPPRKDMQSDSFNVTAGDIVNERIKKDLTHVPVVGSLFVFVRGVFIDEDAYTLTGKEITILSNRYEIKEGDLISARYEYLTAE